MEHHRIFEITSKADFTSYALETFRFQYRNNEVYRSFCQHLGKTEATINTISEIPFLPIEFFKQKEIRAFTEEHETIFTSSGTTGSIPSKHLVKRIHIYEQSFLKAFELFYGDSKQYAILALLPSYLERSGSSLVYMADKLIKRSAHPDSGFHLKDLKSLKELLLRLDASGTKVILLGVSFALLQLASMGNIKLKNTIVMETGGMKGQHRELVREELHHILKEGFGVVQVHSEYGMTELLSQAYSSGNGIFKSPPWMKVLIRDPEDPFQLQAYGKTGGVNVIDLANLDSCSFIATQDLGRSYRDGTFEILGRFDQADIRGCNLLAL